MNIPFVDLHAQYLSIKKEIDAAIASVIAETAFISGKYARQFEADFAEWLGISHVVACANGTDAIEIMLQAAGIGPGDEVIVPACSWISTSETVSFVGAKPVFVDVSPHFYTIDVEKIEEKITDRTRAIIPVHLYGQAANMQRIMEIAQAHDLIVIEDCAQAHGATWQGQKVGTFGHGATFSFYPGKNLGAYGDAGCMVTRDEQLAKTARMIANHGQLKKHNHFMEGRNSRLDGLQGAILSVKLPYLNYWTQRRQQVAATYDRLLAEKGFLAPQIAEGASHVYHLYVVQVENREQVMKDLKAEGVACAVHYPTPLPFLPPYADRKPQPTDYPASYAAKDRILSLPIYPEMTEEMVAYVVEKLTS
jgi:dTDP-4-amino-4,6-dideoxygalactose transaminase